MLTTTDGRTDEQPDGEDMLFSKLTCGPSAEMSLVLSTQPAPVQLQPYPAATHTFILRDFKNATFYVDCLLYWVDLMLFPMQYFILSRDK